MVLFECGHILVKPHTDVVLVSFPFDVTVPAELIIAAIAFDVFAAFGLFNRRFAIKTLLSRKVLS